MAETGESYTEALRAIESGPARTAPPPFGGATPPADWSEFALRCPAIAAVRRDRDGDGLVEEIAVYDRGSGALLDSLVVPHVPEQAHAAYVEHYVATRCGACWLFVLRRLPQTRGRSLEHIEQELRRSHAR
ncbi:hypothetical protein AB0L00_38020 [Actinoallomurus sp. NPDC052308]|uniref:hypothetical protein n=1 Tax=Actinoallomurus sp. NPDC052308 TaxID=3155530 RepID=UPI003418D7AF